jgi:hypothetical protein
MVDRLVREILSESADSQSDQPRPFSHYAGCPNIVLLGNPGGGKSHLFESSAAHSSGTFVTARNFLNIPAFDQEKLLFIDALDERRAGRGDQDTIDAIVRKLFEVSPRGVRISCRERDWLGESDLAAFMPYFDTSGGSVVLALQDLSRDEQLAVLQGEEGLDPKRFLSEASERGLGDFLTNPQNLIMLARAVKNGGQWPTTRRQLFQISTDLLLREGNRERSRTGDGIYTADELRDAAGAACAVRLISDVEGISLREQGDGPDFPSYRSIFPEDPNRLRAALGRRVFTSGRLSESVDYAHRTIAEFLGGAWLANKVRSGLPLGRVLSLLGDGCHPASELRGLHAWLAVFLPEHAGKLIEGDPYGVLTYGDAASLAPSHRLILLSEISSFSKQDPWFRNSDQSSFALGALSASDMVGAFRALLRSPDANFGMKSLMLDAMAVGAPLPELQVEFSSILIDASVSPALRIKAFHAILNLGDEGRRIALQIYREQLSKDPSDIRVRAEVIAEIYEAGFTPSDIAALVRDALGLETDTVGFSLWQLAECFPIEEAHAVLSAIEPIKRRSKPHEQKPGERRNESQVIHLFDRTLLRLLREDAVSITGEQLWNWLWARRRIKSTSSSVFSKDIKSELEQHQDLLRAAVNEALEALVLDEKQWSFIHKLREATFNALAEDTLLDLASSKALGSQTKPEMREFFYDLAISLSYTNPSGSTAIFEQIFAYANDVPELQAIRDRALTCKIEGWRLRENKHLASENAEYEAEKNSNRRSFEENKPSIKSGEHLNWIAFIAGLYFGDAFNVSRQATPYERLGTALGEENVQVALEGLIACLRNSEIPSLEVVARVSAQNQYYEWWYGLIAGLDEAWLRHPQLNAYSDDLLRTMLAIELLLPTHYYEANVSRLIDRGWKNAALKERPALVRESYIAVARAKLGANDQFVPGIRELLTFPSLAPFRTSVALELLRDYPSPRRSYLEELIQSVLSDPGAHAAFLSIAQPIVGGSGTIDETSRGLWLAAAYLSCPDGYYSELISYAENNPGIVWMLRDLIGNDRDKNEPSIVITVQQTAVIAKTAARHFPSCGHPTSGWSGDRNPWDGADFVRMLINRLSADPSAEATEALVDLVDDKSLISYREHLQHALANQRTRRRDSEYLRADWQQVVDTLANKTPANVRDLHALILAHLEDLKGRIRSTNTDIYKRFWNENSQGRVDNPKSEESCRDVLVDFLRILVQPLGTIVEPEGHMANDRRADIAVSLHRQKVLVELKRDYHSEVWNASETQLDRFYTIDPEAGGFGIYGVFWFGYKDRPVRRHPESRVRPRSAREMEQMLRDMVPPEKRHRIAVVVLDVSGQEHQ